MENSLDEICFPSNEEDFKLITGKSNLLSFQKFKVLTENKFSHVSLEDIDEKLKETVKKRDTNHYFPKDCLVFQEYSAVLKILVDLKYNNSKQLSLNFRPIAFHTIYKFGFLKKGQSLVNISLNREELYMKIKKLVNLGYGLDSKKNISILIKEGYPQYIIDLWEWVVKGEEAFAAAGNDINEFNKSLFVTGIGNLDFDIDEIAKKFLFRDYYDSPLRSKVADFCGWNLKNTEDNSDLETICRNLESKGEFTRSVAVAFFNFDIERSILALDKCEISESDKSAIKMVLGGMKSIIEAQCEEIDRYNGEEEKIVLEEKRVAVIESILKNQIMYIKSLAKQIETNDKYLERILNFISGNSHEVVLDIFNFSDISIWDRFAFAFRFLKTSILQNFLSTYKNHKISLTNFLVFGKNIDTSQILLDYIDNYDDILTVGPLCAFLAAFQFDNKPAIFTKYINIYTKLLTVCQEIEGKRIFEEDYKKLLKKFSRKSILQSTFSVSLRCFNCNTTLNHLKLKEGLGPGSRIYKFVNDTVVRINICPDCKQPLPKCAICLKHITLINPGLDHEQNIAKRPNVQQFLEKFPVN